MTGFAVGDRVTFDSTVYCGECEFCRRGEVNLCNNRQVVGVSCGEFKAPPAKAGGEIIEDEDTDETVEKIIAWLDERKLI